MRYSGRRAQGFTLIEMIVVLALSAVIGGLCTVMMVRAQRLWRVHEERIAAGRAAWRCLNRIARDVRTANAGPVTGSDGVAALSDTLSEAVLGGVKPEALEGATVDDDAIVLSAARAVPLDSGHVVPGRVRFAIKRDEAGRALGLVRQSAVSGKEFEDGFETVMLKNVASLDFQYLDASGAWRSEWENAQETPRAVRITLAAAPERMSGMPDIRRFTTVVTLAGNARIPG